MKIDRTLLYQLFDQNEVMVARFLEIFSTQIPLQLDLLRQAMEKGDVSNIAIIVHGLKSQCRYVGLEEVALLCEQIESSPNAEKVPEWLAQLENELREALEEEY